jgi:hypothetical protein
MGIYGQPNSWQCGPFALKHALLALGIFAHEDELARLAGSTEVRGTNERQLGRAARLYGARLLMERRRDPAGARAALQVRLDAGQPVLLCLDQWEHWVTAVSADDREVVVFDSKYDVPLRLEPWDAVTGRLAFRQRRFGYWTRSLYDLHPVVPYRPCFRLRLAPGRARELLDPVRSDLAAGWDHHARTLLPLTVPSGDQLEIGSSVAAFIGAHRPTILGRVRSLLGAEADAAVTAELDGLAFTAELFPAVLRPEAEAMAVERLARALAASVGAGHRAHAAA